MLYECKDCRLDDRPIEFDSECGFRVHLVEVHRIYARNTMDYIVSNSKIGFKCVRCNNYLTGYCDNCKEKFKFEDGYELYCDRKNHHVHTKCSEYKITQVFKI